MLYVRSSRVCRSVPLASPFSAECFSGFFPAADTCGTSRRLVRRSYRLRSLRFFTRFSMRGFAPWRSAGFVALVVGGFFLSEATSSAVLSSPTCIAVRVLAVLRSNARVRALLKHLTMRWSERRTAVRFTFEMTSTLPPLAMRALVRRRSSRSR